MISVHIGAGFFKVQIEVEYVEKDTVWEFDDGHPWGQLVCSTANQKYARGNLPIITHVDFLRYATPSVDVKPAFLSSDSLLLTLARR
jgi:hypothetical protein